MVPVIVVVVVVDAEGAMETQIDSWLHLKIESIALPQSPGRFGIDHSVSLLDDHATNWNGRQRRIAWRPDGRRRSAANACRNHQRTQATIALHDGLSTSRKGCL